MMGIRQWFGKPSQAQREAEAAVRALLGEIQFTLEDPPEVMQEKERRLREGIEVIRRHREQAEAARSWWAKMIGW